MIERTRLRAGSWAVPALVGGYAAVIALAPKPSVSLALAAPLAVVPLAWWATLKRDRWLMLFFAAALLLPPLPFGWGNSGPHPSVIFIAFGLLAGLFTAGEWRITAAPVNRALGIFFLILLASSAEAVFYSGLRVGVGSLVRVLLFGISVYVFFYRAYAPDGQGVADAVAQTRWLYWIAVLSALFACVDFYFQFPAPAGYGAQFVWLSSGVFRRAQGLFYEASTLGNFCAFFLVMIAAALFTPRGEAPVSRKGLLLGGMIFTAALVLSYSRGSLLNVLVAVAIVLWLNRARLRWGRILLVLGGAALAGVLALRALVPVFAGAYWMRISTSVEYVFSETEGLLSGRLASWRAVLGFLARTPVARADRHRIQDAPVLRLSRAHRDHGQYVLKPAGGNWDRWLGSAGVAQRRDSAGGPARSAVGRSATAVFRKLDAGVLGRPDGTDVYRRSAYLLAGAASLFLGAGGGGAP